MISAIVLAAGRGKRMNSALPKVLHELCGQSLIESVVENLLSVAPDTIIIVGSRELFSHEKWECVFEQIKAKAKDTNIILKLQNEANGTGHALQTAIKDLKLHNGKILVSNGDTPFFRPKTLKQLLDNKAGLTFATMLLKTPEESKYGRVVLDDFLQPIKIVETKDASEEQKKIKLGNAGLYCFSDECILECIYELTNNNNSHEFYITQVVEIAKLKGYDTKNINVEIEEATGIDEPDDIIKCNHQKFLQKIAMEGGVTFQDNNSTILSINTRFGGNCYVGAFNVFGANVEIGDNVKILPFCFLENCKINDNSTIGPFARIKENSTIENDCVIGNFVEIKKSYIGGKTKIKHLSYVGDAKIGGNVNVGAGAIFCNFDGFKKHEINVEDGVNIGANSSLVAPLQIGMRSFIGAGSVITKDVPKETLAVTRAEQRHNLEWEKIKKG